MRLHSLVGLPVLVALFATGCSGGGDGLSDAEQEFADAWAATLEDDENGFGARSDDAACMAEAIMDELGVEPFEEADVTAGDIGTEEEANSPGELLGEGVISDAQTDSILDGWEECVNLSAFLAESATDDFDLDEEGRECFADGLAEDDLGRNLLRTSFTTGDDSPDEALLTDVVELVEACGGTV